MTERQRDKPADSDWYEIRLQGQLDRRWSDWFEGFTLATDSEGNTTLTGPAIDQAALHGLLRRVSDLGVTLISVNPLGTHPAIRLPRKPPPSGAHHDDH